MADRFDYIDELIQYNERPHPRQRVLRDRLHPLDKYDDVDFFDRHSFWWSEGEKQTVTVRKLLVDKGPSKFYFLV